MSCKMACLLAVQLEFLDIGLARRQSDDEGSRDPEGGNGMDDLRR